MEIEIIGTKIVLIMLASMLTCKCLPNEEALQLKNIRISIKLIVVGTLLIVVAVWH